MKLGPVQILVIGFEDGRFSGEILAELWRLREHAIVRLVDLLFVARDENGEIEAVEHSDRAEDEARAFGALAGGLLRMGAATVETRGSVVDRDNIRRVADAIPPGGSAGIAVLEHRWAIPLSDAIERAGGTTLVDSWIHPADLLAASADAARLS